MSPYVDSVNVIDSPFLEMDEGHYWDQEYFVEQFHASAQRRMLVILTVVCTIIVSWGLFIMQRDVQFSPQAPSVEAAEVSAVQQPVVLAEASQETVEVALAAGAISPIFTPEVRHWEDKILQWSAEHDLDPNIVATIMQIESCGDPQAVSSAGARGLFQVMPFHFTGNEDMLDPDTNARRGLNFYNEQLRYTGGDKLLSFAGYNGGYAASGGAYAQWADETKRYHTWAKGIYEDTVAGATSSETLQTWLAAGGAAGCQRAASRLNLG